MQFFFAETAGSKGETLEKAGAGTKGDGEREDGRGKGKKLGQGTVITGEEAKIFKSKMGRGGKGTTM